MEYIYPSYYPDFQCIGGSCPDTCCAGWEIVIDDRSLECYRRYPGGFGNRLRNSIDFRKKSFRQYDRRCAFLNEENLCDIYSEAGQGMLCRTCRRYPRHIEEYENVREISLSLSCPEAARLILSQDSLILKRMQRQRASEDYGDFDELLFSQLLDARQVLFDLIQNNENDMNTRMLMILSLSHHLQRNISEDQLFGMENVYERYLRAGAGIRCREYMIRQKNERDTKTVEEERFRVMEDMFHALHRLEILSEEWPRIVRHCEKELFGAGPKHYSKLRRWRMPEKLREQLLNYFIYVYFAGAVYDGKPYVKVKLAVVSVLIIEDMLRVTAADKGNVSLEDCIDAAHRYAREVEHSDLNLQCMTDMLRHEACFHILSLTAVLE